MKKIILLILPLLLLITGCGEQVDGKLSCERTVQGDSVTIQETQYYEVEDSSAKVLNIQMIITFNDTSINTSDYLKKLNTAYENYIDKKGIVYSSNLDGKIITQNIKIKYANIDASEFTADELAEALPDYNVNISIEKTKDELEADSYVCSLKK